MCSAHGRLLEIIIMKRGDNGDSGRKGRGVFFRVGWKKFKKKKDWAKLRLT